MRSLLFVPVAVALVLTLPLAGAGGVSSPSGTQTGNGIVAQSVKCASSADATPSGLVVVLPPVTPGKQEDRSRALQALNNPSISGVAVQMNWSDIEPVQGKPDWSDLDYLLSAATSSKKWVHLLLFPGFFSPAWALEGAKTDQFAIQYGPGKGELKTLPMPWDKVYLANWFAFVKQLSDRYGKSPALRIVAAAGPTSVSAEMTLPNSPQDVTKWQADSYTPHKYTAAWQEALQAYGDDFPNQCVSVSSGFGLNIGERGRLDAAERTSTRQAIVDQAMDLLGHRFVLQSSNVHAGAGPHSPNSEVDDAFVIAYSGRTITGLQMRTSAEGSSGVMGAEGNPPLALRRSIDLAMKPNDSGQHVNYLEIYEPDVVADEMQSVLRYGASLFTQQHYK